jgi:uncharacterized coiled-coil DUF342 family protein
MEADTLAREYVQISAQLKQDAERIKTARKTLKSVEARLMKAMRDANRSTLSSGDVQFTLQDKLDVKATN